MRVLQSQIAMTPRGVLPHRARDAPARDARPRGSRRRAACEALGQGSNPLTAVVGVVETRRRSGARARQDAVRSAARLRRRGEGAQERQGRVRDRGAGDRHLHGDRAPRAAPSATTRRAKLAASILADEEQMLERILREIPKLTDAVVRAEVEGKPLLRHHDDRRRRRRPRGRRGDQGRRAQDDRRRPSAPRARRARSRASPRPRARSRAPSRPRATSRSRATTRSPPTRSRARLTELSQIDLAKIDSYERRNQNRTTVLSRITHAARRRAVGRATTS